MAETVVFLGGVFLAGHLWGDKLVNVVNWEAAKPPCLSSGKPSSRSDACKSCKQIFSRDELDFCWHCHECARRIAAEARSEGNFDSGGPDFGGVGIGDACSGGADCHDGVCEGPDCH